MFKKILVHTRRSMKIFILLVISLLVIVGIIGYFYKISYKVSIDDEQVGYTDNKSKLQAKINEYTENGEDENTAFIQVDSLPEYSVCLLKRSVESNDDEIFEKIKSEGITYYRYYAILDNQEEKAYVWDIGQNKKLLTIPPIFWIYQKF